MDAGDAGPEKAGVGGSTPSLATIQINQLGRNHRKAFSPVSAHDSKYPTSIHPGVARL
jgi:hypothetical protein